MSLGLVATLSKIYKDCFPIMVEQIFNPGALKTYIYIDTLNLQSGVQKIEFLGVGRFSTEKHSLYCLALKHDTH